MAANQKRIPKDPQGFPLPSAYNENADRHDPLHGTGGAVRVRVVDGDSATLGSRADAPSSGDLTQAFTVVSLLKEAAQHLRNIAS